MMATDLMLDIETLGTKPGCVVLSVAAVPFHPRAGRFGTEAFYAKIDPVSSERAGLDIEARTLTWWLEQPEEARLEAFANPQDLTHVAVEFTEFYEGLAPIERIWAQGMDFDMPIWKAAMEAVGVQAPWQFWMARDTRSFYTAAEVQRGFSARDVPRRGLHHSALDDALHQIRCMQYAACAL